MMYGLKAVFRAGAVLALCLAAGCKFKNNPPDTPATPTGPTEVFTNSIAPYVSSAADPDGDSVYLGFGWGDGGYESVMDWKLAASGDTASMQANWDWYNSGTYRLRVVALDQHGYYSDWSQWLTITVSESVGRMKEESRQGPDTKKEPQ